MPALVRVRTIVLLPLMAFAVLLGLTAVGPVADAAVPGRSQRVEHAASVALHQIGDPYRYGASGPGAFDCSGLMQYSFGAAGIRLPRSSSAQAQSARHISKGRLRRGDLMFFVHGGHVYHAAMFLRWSRGAAVMVHAPRSGERVRVERAWTNGWFAATVR